MARKVLFILITLFIILGVAFSVSATTRLGLVLTPKGETHKAITINPHFPQHISLQIPSKQRVRRYTTCVLQGYKLYVDGNGVTEIFPAGQPINLSYLGVGVYRIEVFPVYECSDPETKKVLFKGIGFGQGPLIYERLEILPIPKPPTGVEVSKSDK